LLIPPAAIRQENRNGIFDGPDPDRRHAINLDEDFGLLDDEGNEVPIYDFDGDRIPRRTPVVDPGQPPCGVLLDLMDIQTLFNAVADVPDDASTSAAEEAADLESPYVDIDVFPLAFLRTVGNIQANGVPHCFNSILAEINGHVGKRRRAHDADHYGRADVAEDEDFEMVVDEEHVDEEDVEDVDRSRRVPNRPPRRVVRAVATQFYNYITHRVAAQAGGHDTQQGTVTAAVSGAFATTRKHKRIATEKGSYCDRKLPFRRFHDRISIEDCPTSCRAELVYSIDIRGLENPSGTYVSFQTWTVYLILPQAFSPPSQLDIQGHNPSPRALLGHGPRTRHHQGLLGGPQARCMCNRLSLAASNPMFCSFASFSFLYV